VADPRPPAVALEGVAKRFGAVVALRGVSLSVAEGEFVCFLGPSGCGKTTLLRIIAGLEPQSVGVVRMAGRDVSALPPRHRNYGIVFQSYALFPNLTVARNIAYGLETRRLGRARVEARVDELLDLVHLRASRIRDVAFHQFKVAAGFSYLHCFHLGHFVSPGFRSSDVCS